MMNLASAYRVLYITTLILLALGILLALIRAIIGPRIADRLMGINMIGTMAIIAIAVLSKLLEQSYLLDVCLIYCMLSFLSIIVLGKAYLAIHRERMKKKKTGGSNHA